MTAPTDHYFGIDLHKRQAQVAVLDDEDEVVEEVRVANADLDEIAQKYAGSNAAFEAGSNYFTIYDRLDEELGVTLANPAKADWLDNHVQYELPRHCRWITNRGAGLSSRLNVLRSAH